MELSRTPGGFEIELGSSPDRLKMVVVGLAAAAAGAGAPLFLAALLVGTQQLIPPFVIAVAVVVGALCFVLGASAAWTRRRVVADGDMLVIEERHLLSPTGRTRFSLAGVDAAEVVEVTTGEGTEQVKQHVIRLHYPHGALSKAADVWLPLHAHELEKLATELEHLGISARRS